jgi:hypothetical protein
MNIKTSLRNRLAAVTVALVLGAGLGAGSAAAHGAESVPPTSEMASASVTGPTYTTYQGRSSGATCGTPRSILYFEPAAAGPHPLLLWVTGTSQLYNEPTAYAYLEYMAEVGFVAAAVEYDNDFDLAESSLQQKAECIFGSAAPQSAANVLDALPSVDTSKGIFVSGLSQGAMLSNLSKNHNDDVRAAWLTGVGDRIFGVTYPSQLFSNTALVNVRATNGQQDTVFGSQYCFSPGTSNAVELEHVTGVDYGSPCWPDTSGGGNTTDVSWYAVPGLSHAGVWYGNATAPCSSPWSRCAIRAWALTQVVP